MKVWSVDTGFAPVQMYVYMYICTHTWGLVPSVRDCQWVDFSLLISFSFMNDKLDSVPFFRSYRVCLAVNEKMVIYRHLSCDYETGIHVADLWECKLVRLWHKQNLSRFAFCCEVDEEHHLNNTLMKQTQTNIAAVCLLAGCSLRPTRTASLVYGSLHVVLPKSN